MPKLFYRYFGRILAVFYSLSLLGMTLQISHLREQGSNGDVVIFGFSLLKVQTQKISDGTLLTVSLGDSLLFYSTLLLFLSAVSGWAIYTLHNRKLDKIKPLG
jgi:hypothetical protein